MKMKGYRSIGVSLAGMLVGVLASTGIVVPQDVEAGVATIISFAIMLGMRLITTGKVGAP